MFSKLKKPFKILFCGASITCTACVNISHHGVEKKNDESISKQLEERIYTLTSKKEEVKLPNKYNGRELRKYSSQINTQNTSFKVQEGSVYNYTHYPITDLPKDAIQLNVQLKPHNIPISIEVPKNSINITLSKSPLLWLTFILSAVTLVLSVLTFIDKIKKDKKDEKKSLMDDFWFRTVIHPECMKAIDSLLGTIDNSYSNKAFSPSDFDSINSAVFKATAELEQLNVLSNGESTYTDINKILDKVAIHASSYLNLKQGNFTADELEADGTPVPRSLIEGQVYQYSSDLRRNLLSKLLNFHVDLMPS